jgi:transcriptional regulator of arginine metabolism
MTGKSQRRHKIVELIEEQRIQSQEQLKQLLSEAGFEATQATLSRDLRDLQVSKGPSGYLLPGSAPAPRRGARELEDALRTHLLGVDRGGTIVVARTPPGHAQALAIAVDQARVRGVIGTVAGDDTVMIATRSTTQAGNVAHLLRQLASQG